MKDIEDVLKNLKEMEKHNIKKWKVTDQDENSIYFKIGKRPEIGYHEKWNIKVDDSDHFNIYCNKCEEEATIHEMWLTSVAGGCIHFLVHCKNCKVAGQRKMYLCKDR